MPSVQDGIFFNKKTRHFGRVENERKKLLIDE